MAKEVVIYIKPDGTVSVEAVGFEGSGCEKATQAIRDALGETVAITRKPEFQRTVKGTDTVKRKASY